MSDADLSRKQKSILRRQLAVRGFGALGNVQWRQVLLLKRLGLMKQAKPPEKRKEIRDACLDEKHANRVPISAGPLIIIQDGERNRVVSNVCDLLLHPDADIRNAGIVQLLRFSGNERVLTPQSEAIFKKNVSKLSSAKPATWQQAALDVTKVLADDFLLDLAGFRQSIEAHYEQGTTKYGKAVFQPQLLPMGSISEPLCTITALRKDAQDGIEKSVAKASTLEELLGTYYKICGHLPLAGAFSAARFVGDWIRDHAEEKDIWGRIWRWADDNESPYARYHACQVFSQHPDLIPVNECQRFWEEVREILILGRIEDAATPRWQAWSLRCEMARHYCQHLECQRPAGNAGETAAAFAWWLADQVASVLGTDESYLASVREGAAAGYLEQSTVRWELSHPWAGPSSLRYATLNLRYAWSNALASQLEKVVNPKFFDVLTDEELQSMSEGLLACLLTGIPYSAAGDEAVFAFDLPLTKIAEQWSSQESVQKCSRRDCEGKSNTGSGRETEPGGETRGTAPRGLRATVSDELNFFSNLIRDIRTGERFAEAFKRLADAPLADALLITNLLRVAVYHGKADWALIEKQMSDTEWRTKVLKEAPSDSLQLLFDALAEIQYTLDNKARCEFPHYFVEQIEKGDLSAERMDLLYSFSVLMSIYTDTSSALRRLARIKGNKELEKHAEKWREHLRRFRKDVPPWILARVRAVMAAMP